MISAVNDNSSVEKRSKRRQAFALSALNKRLIIGVIITRMREGKRDRAAFTISFTIIDTYYIYLYTYIYIHTICIKLSMKRNCTRRVIILRNALLPFCLHDATPEEVSRIYQLKVSNCIYGFSLCLVSSLPPSPCLSLPLSRASCVYRQIAFRFCAQVVSLQPHCTLRPCGWPPVLRKYGYTTLYVDNERARVRAKV